MIVTSHETSGMALILS